MAWPGLGKCTAYPRPGQDGPPLGVRWFSEGLGVTADNWGVVFFVQRTYCVDEVSSPEVSSFALSL